MALKRNQTFHEKLIPLLVEGIGAESYLEFGTHQNETIGQVECERRYGVDMNYASRSYSWLKHFYMSTQEFIESEAAKYAPFDFVFIDADHSAKAVEADFNGIWPYVSPEGIVCLHDTNPELKSDTEPGFCGDSWLFAMAMTLDRTRFEKFECLTLPYHPGLTIVRKRALWGPQA